MTRKGPRNTRGPQQAHGLLLTSTAGLSPKLLFRCMKQRCVFSVLKRKDAKATTVKAPISSKGQGKEPLSFVL